MPSAARVDEVEPRRKTRPVAPARPCGSSPAARRRSPSASCASRVRGLGSPVRHRPNHCQLVGPGRQARQMLAVADAQRLGGDRLELSANFDGASGFRSKVSRWLGAPVRNISTTDFALARFGAAVPAVACPVQSDGTPMPSRPEYPTCNSSRRVKPIACRWPPRDRSIIRTSRHSCPQSCICAVDCFTECYTFV